MLTELDVIFKTGVRIEVNLHRISVGAKILKHHEEIDKYAQSWVDKMITEKFYGHRDMEGNLIGNRLKLKGFPVRYAGENRAWGSRSDPAELFNSFLSSSTHRHTIEAGGFEFTGIGTSVDNLGGNYYLTDEKRYAYLGSGHRFFVQIFYTPY